TSESSPSNTGNVTFSGLLFLRNAGALQANSRIYDPPTGRWRQEDPIRWQAGDGNLDRYTFNNSTNLTDPSGEAPPPTPTPQSRPGAMATPPPMPPAVQMPSGPTGVMLQNRPQNAIGPHPTVQDYVRMAEAEKMRIEALNRSGLAIGAAMTR